MSKSRWFYDHQGQVGGPVSVSELKHLAASGQLLPGDRVRKEDMDRWVKARAVQGLFAPTKAAEAGAPAESNDGDTVFDFFGASTPPSPEPEAEAERFNPAFDFFGAASYGPPAAAEVEMYSAAAPSTEKSPRPRKAKSIPPEAPVVPGPTPADSSGSFSFSAPTGATEETPVAFTADVPMAAPVFDEEVPFAAPASGVGLTSPPLELAGPEVALRPDGTAEVTGVTVEWAVSGSWLVARCGVNETHLRLSRLDAVTLRDRPPVGLVLSFHAGGEAVAVKCDGDAEPARGFLRRLLASVGA